MTVSYAMGAVGVVAAALANLVALQDPIAPVMIVPAINLTAIILGSIAMGSMFNRVRQLERRMDKVQRKVFHEDEGLS